jgi:hypothetical protein
MSQNTIIPFGKHKGKDLLFVAEWDAPYLLWLQTVAKDKLLDDVNAFVKTDYFKDCLREAREEEYEENGSYYWDNQGD